MGTYPKSQSTVRALSTSDQFSTKSVHSSRVREATMPNVGSKILLSSSHGYIKKTSRPDDRHFMEPDLFKDWYIEASGGRHAQTFLQELKNLENSGRLRQKLAGKKVIVNLHGGNDLSRLDKQLAWFNTEA